MASQGSGAIRLEWADNQLRLTAKGDEIGEITMQVPATTEGPGRIAFSLHCLILPRKYVSGKQGMVKLSVQGEGATAAVLTHHGQANHALMPMLVQWDTPSPYPPEPPKEETGEPAPVSEAAESVHVGEIGDPDGPQDDPVFSEATPVEDPGADIAPPEPVPASTDQPPTRAEATTKPRRGRKAKPEKASFRGRTA